MKHRRRNPGWFKPGTDARRRRGFTRAECQRGYRAALAKCLSTDGRYQFWLCVRVYGFYGGKEYRSSKL
jgi:hypothetical protein